MVKIRIFSIFNVFLFIIFSHLFLQAQSKESTYYKPDTTYSGKPDTVLTMDFSHIQKPASIVSFNPLPHLPPVRQDTTGTCWAFAATSFLESELIRLGKGEIKLSEMFIVYHEYIEKARRFVHQLGDSEFLEGSQADAAIQRVRQYGIVRKSDYFGLLPGQTTHTHKKLKKEMDAYLTFIEENEYWDEDIVIENIKLILNKHLGKPPATINVDGKNITPLEFAENVLQLPLNDYVNFISFKYIPFYTKGEYKVPDNWWHNANYLNVPLPEWYETMKQVLKKGFTFAIGGDVSEVGKYGEGDIAIIPDFDIAPKYINQDAREFRFDNESTFDDHIIHVVGYQRFKGHDWFLIKDSGYSATKGKFKGYYFFRGDYMKLKVLVFTVHKDAVSDMLATFKSNEGGMK